jgi:hypothetical protein
MSFKMPYESADIIREKFVCDMHELYVEEYRKFLMKAAEQAVEEAVESMSQKLKTHVDMEHSLTLDRPIINVLLKVIGG